MAINSPFAGYLNPQHREYTILLYRLSAEIGKTLVKINKICSLGAFVNKMSKNHLINMNRLILESKRFFSPDFRIRANFY